ncbi:hypothetical protein ACN95_14725 [Gordonia sihwensis]|uniref:Uncharacterized protein n=1 Tax=Gordonia sihwensis NBRC 108236 TaxID=1223544 RepID=L7LGQ9_9ACTN|nr:hypothetical protein CXX93_10375 [Gordonia sp. YC-JH1]MBY4571272.1 hypothetical protein [Gordonia sihwensis]GAC59916.1 hypothetical protein GSI01S_06_00700 [Gordonia sihwensis NBRC 108236]
MATIEAGTRVGVGEYVSNAADAHGTRADAAEPDDLRLWPPPTVGLLADPGASRQLAEAIGGDLAEDLGDDLGGQWSVEVSEESLPIAPSGAIPLAERTPDLLRRHRWRYVVYLTDLTHYRGRSALRYLLAAGEPAVVVFVPTLGCSRRRTKVRTLVREILRADAETDTGVDYRPGGHSHVWPPASQLPDDGVRGPLGHARMLTGMVHSNRPAAMGRALRGCTAVGMASGAFGIFFGSVWPIADSMSFARLAAVSVCVISALSSWLILRNGLWTRRRRNLAPQSGALDNASTVVTVSSAVTLMHVILFVGLTVLATAVVEPAYLASRLGHAVSVVDYLVIGWFAASMGTMAGALGSNFDNEEVVREATYSQRWHQRRLMFEDYSG